MTTQDDLDVFTEEYESVLAMLDNIDPLDMVGLLANYCAVEAVVGDASSGLHALALLVHRSLALIDPSHAPSVTAIMASMPQSLRSM